jgi:hypothetical protein
MPATFYIASLPFQDTLHGGGFLLRAANTFGTARRVADALRRSPEFNSL